MRVAARRVLLPPHSSRPRAAAVPPIELPVAFEGGLTLLGYKLDPATLRPGETANFGDRVWRVDGVPGRLLSIMAHALGPMGV